MNIVLTSVHIKESPDAVPLAPALLKSYIEEFNSKNVKSCSIFESYLSISPEIFAKTIMEKDPDMVGLSIYLWNRQYYIDLVKILLSKNADLIIFAGGPEVVNNSDSLIKSGIKYILFGEGEDSLSRLINSFNNKNTPLHGINDYTNQYVNDIDSIPSPILNGSLDINNNSGLLWELSRGCPFKCDFCFESRGASGVRYYSLDRVKSELNKIIKSTVSQVFVLDPTFNKDIKRAKKILKLIRDCNSGIHFHFEVRAEFIDNELAQLFTEIGASLQIGLQSSHDNVLQNVNRRIDPNKFKGKIELLNRNSTVFGLDLIFGLPGDSYDGFKKSLEFVLSMQPNHIDIFPLAILPGTKLFDDRDRLKLNYLNEPPYTILSSPSFSENDMQKSYKLKKGADFIYNTCRSTGWFKQVCSEIRVPMTKFIEDFIDSKLFDNLDSCNPIDQLLSFIEMHYKPKYFKLIRDLIVYHTAYSDAILNEKKRTNLGANKLKTSTVTLSPTATIDFFYYPIIDAIDNGFFLIKDIKRFFKEDKNYFVSWFDSNGEVIFEQFNRNIMSFLFNIKKSDELYKNYKSDREFLIYAQNSGLLLFS